MNHERKPLWAGAALLGSILLVMSASAQNGETRNLATTSGTKLSVEGESPSLERTTAWLNSQPLGAEDLRGKVVLIQFWTYTCINWRRTLPYIRAWAEKYRHQGLVVIGVHTREFPFER